MRFVILVPFFLCSVDVVIVSEGPGDKLGLPAFIKEPPSVVYYKLADEKSGTNELPNSFELKAVVYPSNATVTIATAHPDDPENYLFLPILRTSTHIDRISSAVSFRQPYAILHSSSSVILKQSDQTYDTVTWKATVCNLPPNSVLHLLASTSSGTTRSRPTKLIQIELPGFPRYADESLSLLIGNTGRLVCHLPRAQPSLPTVNFYHNGARLDLSDGIRYRLIYLGGDWTGFPWEERALQLHQQPQPQLSKPAPDVIFNKPVPSAAILLIHPLRLTDSGEYRCQARIGGKEVFSEQRTLLNVTKPHVKVPARLQFSFDDPELSYVYSHLIASPATSPTGTATSDHLSAQVAAVSDLNSIAVSKGLGDDGAGTRLTSSTPTRVFTVPEGMNLSLFCIYEGAPIVSTRWFFDAPDTNVYQDSQFGVLTISRVTKSNEATYTCSPNTPRSDAISKSLKIVVKNRNELVMEPGPLITVGVGQNISLSCSYAMKNGPKVSSTNSASMQLPSSESISDFRHFQLGTDLGWYHNGKSIEIKQKYGKVFIEATRLHIINVSNYDQGIYQCWTLDNTGAWTTVASAVTLGSESQQYKEFLEAKPEEGILRERTREGLTGHMTCNISTILITNTFTRADLGIQPDDVVVVWYRGASDSEPIDLSSNQSGGIKYLRTTVDWSSQILSVVNPRKSKDDGLYACKEDGNTWPVG
ncbi:unnamed protein product [Echinostoma caproni]|uniref:Ig-like domain-containing protein n=1 Tax=Echinostoma caproni TaxID=27848 RepID=A0A183A5L4_9TREM|nr:unnamed protein product [Echinostoma caproni]